MSALDLRGAYLRYRQDRRQVLRGQPRLGPPGANLAEVDRTVQQGGQGQCCAQNLATALAIRPVKFLKLGHVWVCASYSARVMP